MRDEVIGRVEERETTDRFLVRLLDLVTDRPSPHLVIGCRARS